MFIKPKFELRDLVLWTRRETLIFFLYALVITALYDIVGLKFLQLPWAPIALIGTAVAFIIGFQNNATYERVWKARQIWGSVLRSSRLWCISISNMVKGNDEGLEAQEINEIKKKLLNRQYAWITALRHAMRTRRPWEVTSTAKSSKEWTDKLYVPEYKVSVQEDLVQYLTDEESEYVLSRVNPCTAIMQLQYRDVMTLREKGIMWEFDQQQLHSQIKEMLTIQGQSEGIKNFPYPRQYTTMSHYLVWTIAFLLPFALLPAFEQLDITLHTKYGYGEHTMIWVTVPFCTVIAWVFHTMQKMGLLGENPFEGTVNDVPISQIARRTEIEIMDLMGVPTEDQPSPFPIERDVVM